MASLPDGRYLSAFGRVRADTGGKTIAMLERNRLLTTTYGVATTVLSLDVAPGFDAVREALTARGLLVPGMDLLNLLEWYRAAPPHVLTAGADRRGALPDVLADLGAHEAVDVPHPDGTVDLTEHRDRTDGQVVARDHRRPDGSVYLRLAGPRVGAGGQTQVTLVDHTGRPVRSWPQRRGLHRHWLQALAEDAKRVFLFTDTATVLDQLWPLPDRRFRSVHVLHEIHVRTGGPHGRPLSEAPLHGSFASLARHLDRLDALVVLTEEERRDVRRRVGDDRTRLALVPNPIAQVRPTVPPAARERATFVMMARLTRAKAVDRAIEAFADVVLRHPDARLEVYGEGPDHDDLARLVERRGLRRNVVLCGYDPAARARLDVATGFLSTATKETFGLSLLEAMARGCPVVAYSVPYGPREFVHDDVDGFLVEDGDTAALADRVCDLIESSERVERLSRGARATAAGFAPERVAERWRDLLSALAR